jgi:dipeptidyl aminopeptidase/acylaminoacyl peptidase
MKQQNIEFKVGESILRGIISIPDGKGPFPAVISFHGSESKGETYYELTERLAKKGILGFAFNYRGCGKSDGDIKEQSLGMGVEDVKTALKLFLSRKDVNKQKIGISGSSYGGYLASLIATEYDFKSMVLVVPAAYAPSSMSLIHGTFIQEMDDFRKSASYKEIKKFKGDLLIFKAEFDDILPKGMVEKYAESAINARKKEFFLLKSAKHRLKLFPKAKEIMLKKTITWFLETL